MAKNKVTISDSVALNSDELEFSHIRASGPGGQNVNKVSSAVQLRFDVMASSALETDVKHRLIRIAGQKATQDGVIVIEAKRFRHQQRNKEDALDRLVLLIRHALHTDKPRKKSRPTRNSVQRRLGEKKKRGFVKEMRRAPKMSD